MAALNFNNLLNIKASETKAPEPLPVGTYRAKGKAYQYKEPKGNRTVGIVSFPYAVLAAEDDVDPDQLEAYLASSNFGAAKVAKDIFLNDSDDEKVAADPITKYLTNNVGVEVDPEASLKETLALHNGAEVLIHIVHKMREGSDVPDMRIDSVTPA